MSNVRHIDQHPVFLGRQILRWWDWLTQDGETPHALEAWSIYLEKTHKRYGSELFDRALAWAMQLQESEREKGMRQ